ncbi:MAG TPA: hypothetical protein PKJ45_11975 [Rubrivivax sp.]|nr:hypothetical protein [Rubrivivax sp.]
MPGFESSNPDAAVPPADARLPCAPGAPDAPGPGDAAARARMRRGRLKLVLLLLIYALPVIASYLAYYVIRPEGRTNYGTLIQPTRSLPELGATTLNGKTVPLRSLRGQWLLVAVGSSDCDGACEQRLYAQRQLREMLGRERDRLDKVWLLTDDGVLKTALQQALNAEPPVTVLRVPQSGLAQWLEPEAGHALQDHLYLVDPMGEWMMRFPVEFDPSKVKRDIDRLLRASASWDRAGR